MDVFYSRLLPHPAANFPCFKKSANILIKTGQWSSNQIQNGQIYIHRDRMLDNKFPNYDKKNYPFYGVKFLLEKFEPTNQNSIQVAKVSSKWMRKCV